MPSGGDALRQVGRNNLAFVQLASISLWLRLHESASGYQFHSKILTPNTAPAQGDHELAGGPWTPAPHGFAQSKSRPQAAFNSILIVVDQAAINACFDFRRYAMKPMPAKPRIIIAQVEGSGTAGETVIASDEIEICVTVPEEASPGTAKSS